MADVIGRSERFVYLRVKVPRQSFESLCERFGSMSVALRHLRLRWEQSFARVETASLSERADGSASSVPLSRIL
jgi:hypothetical protein